MVRSHRMMEVSGVKNDRSSSGFRPAHYPGLENAVVLNTGAGSGIGRAMAHGFARHGARIMLLDVDEAGLLETQAELLAGYPGVQVETFNASVTDESAVEDACAQIVTHCGRIDVLLNNAGIAMNKPSLELTGAEWRRAIDIDLSGVFYCSQAAGRRMVAQGRGCILSTASMWGISTSAGRTAYCTAKAGVVAMTKCLAAEWARHGVRVNAICPGYTRTALVDTLIRNETLDAEVLFRRTPLNRMAAPEEIADVALYLASNAAAFITGHALVSDGGWTADGFGA